MAILAALAIHLALFLLAFSSAPGALVSAAGGGGGPAGPVFEVTLVRPAGADDGKLPGLAAAPSLRLKMRAVNAPEAAPLSTPPDPLRALAARLAMGNRGGPAGRGTPESPAPPTGTRNPAPNRLPTPLQGAHVGAQPGATEGTVSTGGLWGAVAPCWRDLGRRARVPVTLEVALDGRGDLQRPPKVLRDPAAMLDERRLQAEASALAALAACLPRGDLQMAGRVWRLDFPAAGT